MQGHPNRMPTVELHTQSLGLFFNPRTTSLTEKPTPLHS